MVGPPKRRLNLHPRTSPFNGIKENVIPWLKREDNHSMVKKEEKGINLTNLLLIYKAVNT